MNKTEQKKWEINPATTKQKRKKLSYACGGPGGGDGAHPTTPQTPNRTETNGQRMPCSKYVCVCVCVRAHSMFYFHFRFCFLLGRTQKLKKANEEERK